MLSRLLVPLSSEYGTQNTVKARSRRWLSGKSPLRSQAASRNSRRILGFRVWSLGLVYLLKVVLLRHALDFDRAEEHGRRDLLRVRV
jgi:hypothetical protein